LNDAGNSDEAIATYKLAIKADPKNEGRPHVQHDHHGEKQAGGWKVRRSIGIAAATSSEIDAVLKAWTGPGASTLELTCGLAAS
jgi:hypothetical protein